MFDLDGINNSENNRIRAVNREETNGRGASQKVTVWLAVCSENVAPFVLFEKGTLDRHRYIKEVLPVVLRYENNWIFQQDNGTSHTHQETQDWCSQHFPSFIDKDTWPANTPDLNPLDYCIWDEFAQAINWDNVTSNEARREKNSFECCKGKLFCLNESFVSHDTRRWKLFKRIKSSFSDRESKDESF